MNLRDELARIIANDPRFTIEAYAFTLEALGHARQLKLEARSRDREKARKSPPPERRPTGKRASRAGTGEPGHVTGRELCDSVRRLGLRQFGMLAPTILAHWGVTSTSDIGDIVYHMIDAGDLEKTPNDSRSDFDDVFDFETAFKPSSLLASDD
jgi:uncharacterized repeat protein (TIGR04138 family)